MSLGFGNVGVRENDSKPPSNCIGQPGCWEGHEPPPTAPLPGRDAEHPSACEPVSSAPRPLPVLSEVVLLSLTPAVRYSVLARNLRLSLRNSWQQELKKCINLDL